MVNEIRQSRPWLAIGLGGITSLVFVPFCLVAAGLSWWAYTTATGTLASILTVAAAIFFFLLPVVPVAASIIAILFNNDN